MSTVTEFTQATQEQTLAVVKQSQQVAVEAVRVWAQAVERVVPRVPALPFAEQLPSPREVVQANFSFAERLLHAQRDFAEQVVAAATPALNTARTATPKRPAKAAAAPKPSTRAS